MVCHEAMDNSVTLIQILCNCADSLGVNTIVYDEEIKCCVEQKVMRQERSYNPCGCLQCRTNDRVSLNLSSLEGSECRLKQKSALY